MDITNVLAELAAIGAVGSLPTSEVEEEVSEPEPEAPKVSAEVRAKIADLYQATTDLAEGFTKFAADLQLLTTQFAALDQSLQEFQNLLGDLTDESLSETQTPTFVSGPAPAPGVPTRAAFYVDMSQDPEALLATAERLKGSPEYLAARERARQKLLDVPHLAGQADMDPDFPPPARGEEEDDIPFVGAVRITPSTVEETSVRSLGTIVPSYPKEI